MDELTRYVIYYYGHLMQPLERLAHKLILLDQKHPRIRAHVENHHPEEDVRKAREMLRIGADQFLVMVRDRILKDHGHEVLLNNCPKCGKLTKSPRALQCLTCGHDWHSDSAKRQELVERLLADRIVLLGSVINGEASEAVMAQLHLLVQKDRRKPIYLYVNSPGGAVQDSLAVYETIKELDTPIHTYCLGQAHGTAMLLVAAGSKQERHSIERGKFQFCSTSGVASPEELESLQDRLAQLLSRETGREFERVRADMAMEATLDAEGALKYGLIDTIVPFPGR